MELLMNPLFYAFVKRKLLLLCLCVLFILVITAVLCLRALKKQQKQPK